MGRAVAARDRARARSSSSTCRTTSRRPTSCSPRAKAITRSSTPSATPRWASAPSRASSATSTAWRSSRRRSARTFRAPGTTTFRPNYTPVTFGAIAGPDLGETFDPIRKTALHAWHEEQGALFENVGQWKRPWYFPQAGRGPARRRRARMPRRAQRRGHHGRVDARQDRHPGPGRRDVPQLGVHNSWTKLGVGRCRYGLMLDENGMVMDDGVTTRLGDHHFLMTRPPAARRA